MTTTKQVAPDDMDIPVAAVPLQDTDIHVQPSSQGPAAMLPSRHQNKRLGENQIPQLVQQGYTRGLAKSLELSNQAYAKRMWIVDNSGSMQKTDGHRLAETKKNSQVKFVSCSRWEEIQECVNYHIQLAGLLEVPTNFRLLNDPGATVGPQQFSVDGLADVLQAQRIVRNARPGGCTPLTNHILEIHREIQHMEPALRANGQRVVIEIATDGLPTDERGYGGENHKQEFVESLRLLEGLPVWLVVRLCTDENDVVSFYNDLDNLLELSIDVLDDFSGEAEEVHEHNPWLTYGLPLHRLREMGFHDRVFDLLDERKLTRSEVRDFCAILFGNEQMDGIADPSVEWHDFCKDIHRLLKNEKQQWDPIKKKMKPWIDMHVLNSMYGDGDACVIL